MRIALFGPTYPFRGGIAHYTTMLSKALGARGHEVCVVSFKRLYPGWLFPGESDKDPSRVPFLADNVKYWVDSLDPITWILTCFRLSRYEPDVIVLPWWTSFLSPAWFVIASLSRLLLRVPLVFICHNVLPHETRWWDRWAARTVLRKGTHFIVQSDSEQAKLRHLIPPGNSVVVPLPVFDMFSHEPLSQEGARRAISVPDGIPVLLFFGIVREYKGLMDLLDAMPEIRRQLGQVLLIIAGEFWEPRELYDHRIEELGIGDCVRIDDRYIPNEEVPNYFRAADLVVAPHRQATGSAQVNIRFVVDLSLVTTLASHFRGLDLPSSLMIVAPNNSCALAERVVSFLALPTAGNGCDEMKTLQAIFSWQQLVVALEGFVQT